MSLLPSLRRGHTDRVWGSFGCHKGARERVGLLNQSEEWTSAKREDNTCFTTGFMESDDCWIRSRTNYTLRRLPTPFFYIRENKFHKLCFLHLIWFCYILNFMLFWRGLLEEDCDTSYNCLIIIHPMSPLIRRLTKLHPPTIHLCSLVFTFSEELLCTEPRDGQRRRSVWFRGTQPQQCPSGDQGMTPQVEWIRGVTESSVRARRPTVELNNDLSRPSDL